MADVFLSYARPDEKRAKQVAGALRTLGYSVWFDEDLPSHQPYSDVIAAELDGAAAVLVLWSTPAAASQWVRSEANRARETGRLIQARLAGAPLPMPFDQVQCADLARWRPGRDSAAWRNVVASLAALNDREPSEAVPARDGRRRFLITGGAVAAVGALGFAGWREIAQPRVSPQAQLLIDKGLDALQNNDALDTQNTGSTMQAIALLTDATQAAPDSAVAWGALAMAYAVRKRAAPLAERSGLDARSRSAARAALGLDPRETRALGALRLLDPVYRHWADAERADRLALRQNPKLPILLFVMSDMLGSVGRWRDAVQFSKRFDRKSFLIPGAERKLIIDLWSSGDLAAADAALDDAVRHWPQNPQIWQTRIAYLMYSGRAIDALTHLQSGSERPSELSPAFLDTSRAIAQALAGQRDRAAAVAATLADLGDNPSAALQAVQACASLGAGDEAFALLDGYYFADGKWARLAPAGGDQDRVTSPLFQPSARALWADPRFAQLTARIGLDGYWRQSGTAPDFRRAD